MGDVISSNLDEGKREMITGKTHLCYLGMTPLSVQNIYDTLNINAYSELGRNHNRLRELFNRSVQ